MPQWEPFLPAKLGQTTLSVTGAVQHLRLPVGGSNAAADPPIAQGGEAIAISNNGSVVVFLETGPGQPVAGVETCNIVATVANSYPILPGQTQIIRRFPGDTHMSIIGASAGPTAVFVSVGNGI